MKTAAARRVLGTLLVVAGVILTTLGGLAGVAARHVGEVGADAVLLALVTAVVMVGGGVLTYRWGKRISRSAGPLRVDPRPPVLYLRSFQSDRRGSRRPANLPTLVPTHFSTEVEQLALPFRPLGPLEVVHPPEGVLPDLPGRLVRLDDAAWQAEVDARIQRARLVLLRAGASDGLLWEVETCLRRLTPERLIIVVPGSRGTDEYEQFMERFQDRFPRALPAYSGGWREPDWVGALIWFMPDWTPRLEPVQVPFVDRGIPLARSVAAALRPYREQYGVPVHTPAATPLRRILAGCVDVAALAAIVAIESATSGSALVEAVFVVCLFAYFVAFEVSPLRGSPGKRLLGLRMVSPGGLPVSVLQSILRFLAKAMSAVTVIPAVISLVAIFTGRRTLHDLLTDTLVEERPAPVPAAPSAPTGVTPALQ